MRACVALLLALAACTPSIVEPEPLADFDGDGIPDVDDPDADGDGIPDVDDPFVDLDSDTYDRLFDCDDADANVNPGAEETCNNGKDDDCDGTSNACALEGDLPLTQAEQTARPESANDALGSALDVTPDLDGDGYADVLLSAQNVGRSYRLRGGATGLLTVTGADTAWSLGRPGFGAAISGGLDLTGDGLPDVAISEPGFSTDVRSGVGQVVLFPALDTTAGPRVTGDQASAGLGQTVHVGGDANDDGRPDLWVSSAALPTELLLYAFDGPTGTVAASVRGAEGDTTFALGASVADVDGDGIDDLIALSDTESGTRIQVFLGPIVRNRTETSADAHKQVFVSRNTYFTRNGLDTGDQDGDGYAEVVASLGGFSYEGGTEGAVLVLPGSADLSGLSAPGRRIVTDEDQQIGPTGLVHARGDLDGDGDADLAVVSGADVYLFYDLSEDETPITDATARLVGRNEGATIEVLDVAPVANRDGTRTLSLGTPFDDGGRAYLVRLPQL